MNYAIHRISLDVTDDSPSQITISAKQGDSAKILIISLLDDKKNYQIAKGSVAVFIAKKSNGVWLEHPCTIDYSSNKVVYTFNEDTVKSSGTMECEIHLSFVTTVKDKDGKDELITEDLTTASFVIAVHDTILSGLTDETEEATLLPDLITRGTGLFTKLEQETIPNAEKATDNANEAAQEAREVISNLETLTENANNAALFANTAGSNADTARNLAMTATTNANNATENANKATQDARALITDVEGRLDSGAFNGVSASHAWNGTTLVMTSASGTSSADLKGAKGDKGDKGDTSQDFIEHNTGKLTKLFVGTIAEWNAFTGNKTNMLFIPTDDTTREDILEEVDALCKEVSEQRLYRHDITIPKSLFTLETIGSISSFELHFSFYSMKRKLSTADEIVKELPKCFTGFVSASYYATNPQDSSDYMNCSLKGAVGIYSMDSGNMYRVVGCLSDFATINEFGTNSLSVNFSGFFTMPSASTLGANYTVKGVY